MAHTNTPMVRRRKKFNGNRGDDIDIEIGRARKIDGERVQTKKFDDLCNFGFLTVTTTFYINNKLHFLSCLYPKVPLSVRRTFL